MAESTPQPVDPTIVPEPPPILEVPVADAPDTAEAPPAPAVTSSVPEPNYHIILWPDPPGPPLYLCLLCTLRDASEAVIQAHLTTEHNALPLPSAMAASPPAIDPVAGLQAVRRDEEGPPNA